MSDVIYQLVTNSILILNIEMTNYIPAQTSPWKLPGKYITQWDGRQSGKDRWSGRGRSYAMELRTLALFTMFYPFYNALALPPKGNKRS